MQSHFSTHFSISTHGYTKARLYLCGLLLVGMGILLLSSDSHAQSQRDPYATSDATSDATLDPFARNQDDILEPGAEENDDGTVRIQIVGGDEAEPGAYPFQVFLSIENFMCGGTLITPDWIMTAAHCVVDFDLTPAVTAYPPQVITAQLGKHDLRVAEAPQQIRGVDKVFVHPDYNPNNDDADIALLRLASPATLSARVAPIDRIDPLSQNTLQEPGSLATVIGWGATAYEGPSSPVLLEVDVPIVTNQKCSSVYGGITDTMICAGFEEGGKDACQGDSGGPLFVPNPDGGWLQVGIVSFGFKCAEPEFYGVYARVSELATWIDATLAEHSPPQDTDNLLTAMIRNGDFAAGADDWQEESSNFADELILHADELSFSAGVRPYNGMYAAWLGGGDSEVARLSQTVTFHAAATELRYQYWIGSSDSCGRDEAWVAIGDERVYQYQLCQSENTSGWREERIDVRAFRGHNTTLAFHVETDAANISSLFIDNVRLYEDATLQPALSIADATVQARTGITTLAVLTVSLDGPTAPPVAVDFQTESGTAQSPDDFAAKSGSLQFAPGEVEKLIAVEVVGNPGPGAQKTFAVRLQNPSNAQIAKALGQVVIEGSEEPVPALPEISIADATVIESDGNESIALESNGLESNSAARFKVWLSHSSPHTVTVDYATEDGSAIAPQDYVSTTGTLVFEPGVITRTVAVSIAGNSDAGSDRTFFVNLSNPVQATLLRSRATGTIVDDDAGPVLPLLAVSDGVHESEDPASPLLFQVSLSAVSPITVMVEYFTQDGAAIAPDHYLSATGVLTFTPGVISQTVSVDVVGNSTPQPTITFTLVLTNPVNAMLGVDTGVGVLVNEEPGPPEIDSFSPQSGEPGTLVTVEGRGFSHVIRVYFGEVEAAFSVESDTRLVAQTPEGASDAPIRLETATGFAETDSPFIVPEIYWIFIAALFR